MATAPNLVSWDEYMTTSYSPDCEYVDGQILERNVGQGEHSYTQGEILLALNARLRSRGLLILPEQRTQVAPYRSRVPDLSVVAKLRRVTEDPPLLCVEILSPEDQWNRVSIVVADYLQMGVACVWVIDPWARRAWIYDADQPPAEVSDNVLRARHLEINVPLDRVLPPPTED